MNIVLSRKIPADIVNKIISYRDDVLYHEITQHIVKKIKSTITKDYELDIVDMGKETDVLFNSSWTLSSHFSFIFLFFLFEFIKKNPDYFELYPEFVVDDCGFNWSYIYDNRDLILDFWNNNIEMKDRFVFKKQINKLCNNFDLRYKCLYSLPKENFENRTKNMVQQFYLLEKYY
jgi:hypothetical protein